MMEQELTQSLQPLFKSLQVKFAVKVKQGHMHILLSRSASKSIDYPMVTQSLQRKIQELGLTSVGMKGVTVYGRVAGEKQWEWERTFELDPQATLVYRAPSSPNEDEEDELPTEIYQGGSRSDATLVAPYNKPLSRKATVLEQPVSPRQSGSNKSLIMTLAGLGGAAVVLVILLILKRGS
jgi:hypothetical protein